jgi:SHS2 domain-containing protein
VPYRYLEELSSADIAFEARGETLSACFAEACDAVLGVMVADPQQIRPRVRVEYRGSGDDLEMLLFGLLGEIVFRRDAAGLLLRCPAPRVQRGRETADAGGAAPGCRGWSVEACLAGEPMDPARHRPGLEVKAVTLHLLSVEQSSGGWAARVVLDV